MEEGVWFLPAAAGSFAQLVAWQHRIRPLNVSHPIWAALECGGGRHVTPFSSDVIRFLSGRKVKDFLTQSLQRQWHGARVASKHSECQRLTAVKNRHSTLPNRIPTPLTIFGRKYFRDPPQTPEASVVSPLARHRNWVSCWSTAPPGDQGSEQSDGRRGLICPVDKLLDFHRVACEVVSSHTVLKINLVEGRFHMRRSDRYILLCIRWLISAHVHKDKLESVRDTLALKTLGPLAHTKKMGR